jgi:predicted hotdog family 3-hydroxylacyl-ACP dehydratase
VQLDRAWIVAHVPHRGSMCLLDEVIEWSPAGIRCRATSHRSADNPLRARGELGAACGIEYAAQAMAIHGALLAPAAAPRTGMLASARGVTLNVARLDEVPGELIVSATYVHGDAAMVLYDFAVSSAAGVLVTGRAAIAFVSAAPPGGSA